MRGGGRGQLFRAAPFPFLVSCSRRSRPRRAGCNDPPTSGLPRCKGAGPRPRCAAFQPARGEARGGHAPRLRVMVGVSVTLRQTCPRKTSGAICVQRFDDSRNSAIHTTYRISLRSSSLQEPRYPLLRVVRCCVWSGGLGALPLLPRGPFNFSSFFL